jgi:transcriptional regulator with XRE-family HTH domain
MNSEEAYDPPGDGDDIVELGAASPQIILHRLSAVRRAKGIPRRELALRLGISVQELRLKEQSPDLALSTLYHWAARLDVPITELLVEPDECLAPTRLARSQAERLMRAAARLRDRSRRRSIQRLAQTFVDQLAEILPDLEQLAQKNYGRNGHPNRQPRTVAPRPILDRIFTRPPKTEEL